MSEIPPNRKPACTCFCGDGSFDTFALFDMADIKAGKCYGGPLPAEACMRTARSLPPDARGAMCKRMKEKGGKICPVLLKACGQAGIPPREEKCARSAPWFDTGSDCTDIQSPVTAIKQRAVTVSICGSEIFRQIPESMTLPMELEAYRRTVAEEVAGSVGSKICCNKFRGASSTGLPCDPRRDVDCDGKPNQFDKYTNNVGSVYPDINWLIHPRPRR